MKPVLSVLLLAAWPAFAQEADKPASPEPKVQRIVVEDEGVRIDELRVRGQTQRIVVRSKQGPGGTYEVLPESGRAESPSAGKRVWNVLAF